MSKYDNSMPMAHEAVMSWQAGEITRLKALVAQCKEALVCIQAETYADEPNMSFIDSASFDILAAIEKELG
jgi:hypothetical protein